MREVIIPIILIFLAFTIAALWSSQKANCLRHLKQLGFYGQRRVAVLNYFPHVLNCLHSRFLDQTAGLVFSKYLAYSY